MVTRPTSHRSNPRAAGLIHTKLHIPRVRTGLMERPRLLSRLDGGADRRLTLLSAPAGFGKTTLAVQWLERRSPPAAWLTLDSLDSEPERFARYLVAALQGVLPDSCPRSAALLASPTAPPWGYFVETLVAEIAALDEPSWIVLDDYYRVGSAPVQELVQRIVEQLPEALHLLVLTRVDPPWPLVRWRVQRWLAELRAQDLRFSPEEARAFFAADPRLRLADADVDLLRQRTEGWPAGLRLAQVSLLEVADPGRRAREFSGSDRVVVDYFSEVLAAQPPEVRALWAVTARLDRFCAPLCDHLLANRERTVPSHEVLARLEHHNLFLVPLDAEHRWFRYHHLFQELLLRSLEEISSPGLAAEVARRAAEWFEREGLIEEALGLWIDSENLDEAACLLGENLLSVIDEDLSRRVLGRWLARFPPGAERGRAPLLLAHGYQKIISWDLDGIADCLDQAEHCLEADEPLRADLDAQRSFLLFWRGDSEGALRHAERALEQLAFDRRGMAWTLAQAYRAGGLSMSGRGAEGVRLLAEEASREAARGGRHLGEVLFLQGILHLYAADLDAVRTAAARMLTAHETRPISDYFLGYGHYLLGVVALERDHLDEAVEGFRRVGELRFLVNSRLYQDALIGSALVAVRRGDLEGAAATAAEARAYGLQAGDPGSLAIADSFESRLAPATAGGARLGAEPSPAADSMFFFLEVPSATHPANLIRDPDAEVRRRARPFLETAIACAQERHNMRLTIVLTVLLAEALALEGDRDSALEQLARAVRLSARGRMVRPFLERGPRMRELLETLAARRPGDPNLETVLAAFGTGARGAATARELSVATGRGSETDEAKAVLEPWQDLTFRERDVLELLALRLTNKEIAARLSVTSETVKKHTLSVYQKLEVHGRREAVARALALGLVRSE